MRPAFKSTASAAIFCAMLLLLLALPFVTLWIGHPSREQAYADMLGETSGQLGMAIRTTFSDPGDADILLLGSSLLEAGVDIPTLETALSAHLGRPARIKILALNWQGLDEQYFLLRDYLSDHKAKLILWN